MAHKRINEFDLIAKVIDTNSYQDALKFGVTPEFFVSPIARFYWYNVGLYVQRYHTPPSREYLYDLATNGNVDPIPLPASPLDPLEAIISSVRDKNNRLKIQLVLKDVSDMVKKGKPIERVLRSLYKIGDTVFVEQERSIKTAREAVGEFLEDYIKRLRGEIVPGYEWPWEKPNEMSRISQQMYFAFFARPKNMKTYLLMWVGYKAALQGARVIFISPELTELQYKRRLVAMLARLDEKPLRKLEYTEDEIRRLLAAENMDIDFTYIYLKAFDIPTLASEIQKTRPTLVLVDAIHKFYDVETGRQDQSPQVVRNIVRSVGALAREDNIPIGVTVQANRQSSRTNVDAELTDDVAFSDALAQETDILFRIKKINDPLPLEERRALATHDTYLDRDEVVVVYTAATRETEPFGFTIEAYPCVSFDQRYPIAISENNKKGGLNGLERFFGRSNGKGGKQT